jgi:micrococcal nuclease
MYEYTLKNIRVIDGDTIEADIDLGFHVTIRKKLRLAGVNAPEMKSQDPAERNLAVGAKGYVQTYVYNNPYLIGITSKDKVDKYDRMLVEVRAPGADVSLNSLLLLSGNAVKYAE